MNLRETADCDEADCLRAEECFGVADLSADVFSSNGDGLDHYDQVYNRGPERERRDAGR